MKAKRIINTVALTVLLLAGSAAAQTATYTPVTTPGSPNTGSGGSAPANILLLTGSAAIALGGLAMLLRRRTI